jgi:hypothetical protein
MPLNRDDLSNRLIHLTRDSDDSSAEEKFKNIVDSRTLKGSTLLVKGGIKVVCFTEAPISKLGLIMSKGNEKQIRYKPLGVMFKKEYLFKHGARPAIYSPEAEYTLLPQQLRFRYVRFELGDVKDVDWTWEREWRFQIDEFQIDPQEATLIVPTRKWVEEFKEKNHSENIGLSIALGDIPFHEKLAWHFIVLEDLGFDFVK